MSFHVIHPPAGRARQRLKRSDLIGDGGINFRRRQRHFRAAEIFAIRKTGMRAHRNAALQRRLDRGEDRGRIACVKTAGDIGGADEIEDFVVVPGAFPEVGIEIDDEIHDMCRLKPDAEPGKIFFAFAQKSPALPPERLRENEPDRPAKAARQSADRP